MKKKPIEEAARGLAVTAALITCIASASACTSNQAPNQNQPDSNQTQGATVSDGKGALSGSPSRTGDDGDAGGAGGASGDVASDGGADGTGADGATGSGTAGGWEDASAFTASTGPGNFAMWAKGKVSVSDASGEELIFEIDPQSGRTRAWTDLQVDGNVLASGNLRTGSFATDGLIAAGRVTSETGDVGDLSATSLFAQGFSAGTSTIESLAASILDASTLRAGSLEASSLSGGNVGAGSIEADSGAISSLQAGIARAVELVSDRASFSYVTADSSAVNSLRAGQANVDVLDAGSVSASGVSASSIDAGQLSADRVTAATLYGMLDVLHVDGQSAGIAEFPAVDASGNGAYQPAYIRTSSRNDIVVVTPMAQSASVQPLQCTYEVENMGNGLWKIARIFPQSAYEAMQSGLFGGANAVQVCWMGVDIGS